MENLKKEKTVPLPHFEPKKWEIISKVLLTFQEGKIIDYEKFEELLLSIYNVEKKSSIESFPNLKAFFSKVHYLVKDFFKSTLPFLATLALELPTLFPKPLKVFVQNESRSELFSKKQIACLIVNMFFGSIEKIEADNKIHGIINFKYFFEHKNQVLYQKLLFLFNYFSRLESGKIDLDKNITYARLSGKPVPKEKWLLSKTNLSYPSISNEGVIEDFIPDSIQVDFANMYIGGGSLVEGCVQEEIRFVISPECLPSMMMFENMLDHEVIYIIGAEQFSKYSGYGWTFTFAGDYTDNLPKIDEKKRSDINILAMDAINFFNGHPVEQIEESALYRELNKAYIGFKGDEQLLEFSKGKDIIATGRWGCGAFNGYPQLKFLIQLLASSEAGKKMIFYSRNDVCLKDCEKILDVLKEKTVGEVLGILEEYSRQDFEKTLFNFIFEKYSN